MAERLRFSRFLPGPGTVFAARSWYRSDGTRPVHTHDFAEAFWIERGVGLHHGEGWSERLATGSCVVVPPQLAHGFAAVDAAGFSLFNVAFPAVLLDEIRQLAGPWPWGDGARPRVVALAASACDRLAAWADELHPGQDGATARAFLWDLVRLARRSDGRPPLPDPLQRALDELDGRAELPLSYGPAELAAAAGWTVTHLNRVVRARLGCTATALINTRRLARAERLLRLGDLGIADIALRCGFPGLAHFYRLFAAAHGCPPALWRERHRRWEAVD
jgi:AraC family cel operon transcriptional repressor